MIDVLPEEVRLGLEKARQIALNKSNRLCVHDGDDVYRVRQFWADGFSIDIKDAAKLRGRVEIYDGARHLYQCLIVGSRPDGEQMVFEFKWLNPVTKTPAADYVRETPMPAGLLPN